MIEKIDINDLRIGDVFYYTGVLYNDAFFKISSINYNESIIYYDVYHLKESTDVLNDTMLMCAEYYSTFNSDVKEFLKGLTFYKNQRRINIDKYLNLIGK